MTLDVKFEEQDQTFNTNFGEIQTVGGKGGTTDHNELINRDAKDQHPMSAITGLEDALKNVKPQTVQPDWNQSDSTAQDYIKNRTHWVELSPIIDLSGFDGSTNGRDYFDASALGLGVFIKISDQVWSKKQCEQMLLVTSEYGGSMYEDPLISDENVGVIWATPLGAPAAIQFMASAFTAVDLTSQYGFSIPSAGMYVCVSDSYSSFDGYLKTFDVYHTLPMEYMPPQITSPNFELFNGNPIDITFDSTSTVFNKIVIDGNPYEDGNILGELTEDKLTLLKNAKGYKINVRYGSSEFYVNITRILTHDSNRILGTGFLHINDKLISLYIDLSLILSLPAWQVYGKTVYTKNDVQTMIDNAIANLPIYNGEVEEV